MKCNFCEQKKNKRELIDKVFPGTCLDCITKYCIEEQITEPIRIVYQDRIEYKDRVEYKEIKTKAKKKVRVKPDRGSLTKAIYDKYKAYVYRAQDKQILFELTPEEFGNLINQDCVYCKGYGGGIDREIPIKGYTTENSKPCCIMCNTMKFTYIKEEWIAHMHKILNNIS